MSHRIEELTLWQAAQLVRNGEVSSRQLVEALLERIDALDELIGAYLHVNREGALFAAEEWDLRIKKGEQLPPLAGVPIALKDIFITKDIPTTAASRILEGFVPPFEGTHAKRLKRAGAIILGKLNMDEFAMGSSNENSGYKICHNPYDLSRVPGGSSGGSAAAVAAGEAIASLGSDTGGSIRQPAAFCGVVGLKPTYGRISRFGMIAFASSLDQAGPMTKDVKDAAILLSVLAGKDPLDATSVPEPVPDYTKFLGKDVSGIRLGLPKEYFAEGLSDDVKDAVMQAVDTYKALGCEIKEISLPHSRYAVAAYYVIATAEASSNLARYDGIRYGVRAKEYSDLTDYYMKTRSAGFGSEVKRRIMLGTYVLSAGYYDAFYRKAQKVRTLIKQDFEEAFKQVDAIISPTTPSVAFRHAELLDDPLTMYLADIYTISVNLAGLPGISIPCGKSKEGLPIGLQIIAPAFEEGTIFSLAHAFESSTSWHEMKPEI